GYRREVLGFLTSKAGQQLWEDEASQEFPSERKFHAAFLELACTGLKELLRAIDAYERLCRFLQDAFDDVLLRVSQYQKRVPPVDLAPLDGVKRASKAVPNLFPEVTELLSPFGEAIRFQEHFSSLAERVSNADWLERLLEHHCRIQKSKPPTPPG